MDTKNQYAVETQKRIIDNIIRMCREEMKNKPCQECLGGGVVYDDAGKEMPCEWCNGTGNEEGII